jgi:hypothetical protein
VADGIGVGVEEAVGIGASDAVGEGDGKKVGCGVANGVNAGEGWDVTGGTNGTTGCIAAERKTAKKDTVNIVTVSKTVTGL